MYFVIRWRDGEWHACYYGSWRVFRSNRSFSALLASLACYETARIFAVERRG